MNANDFLSPEFISIDAQDTVSKLIGKFKKEKEHTALVFEDKEFLGIVTRRFLLTSRANPSEMKVGNIVKHRSKAKANFFVPELTRETDIKEIAKLLSAADVEVLPVMEKGTVIGVVHAHDIAAAIAESYTTHTCKELASMKPITINEDDDVGKAIDIFNRKGIDHLPVVDKNSVCVGMLTTDDLIEHPNFWNISEHTEPGSHQSRNKNSKTTLPVSNCMSRKQLCCTSPSTKLKQAIKDMTDNGVASIVLLEDKKPVGILTIKDILRDYSKA